MSEIKVSVIIPIYNAGKYIQECIRSVCRQTETNLEVICVNDGSTDDTEEKVQEICAEDARVRYIGKENQGVSAARNTGLDAAKGTYIFFLDSDDYIKENTLERLCGCAEKYTLDELFYCAESFYENKELEEKQAVYADYYTRKGEYLGVKTGQEMFVLMEEYKEFKPSVCLQLFRRGFIEEYGLRFKEGIIHEDNLFTIESMALSKRCLVIKDKLYMRRVREDSIMTKERAFRNVAGYFTVVCEMIQFAEKWKLDANEEYFSVYLHRMDVLSNMGAKAIVEQEIVPDTDAFSAGEKVLFAHGIWNRAQERKKLAQQKKKYEDKLKKANADKRKAETRLEQLKESWAYRVGKVLVMIPSRIKGMFRKH